MSGRLSAWTASLALMALVVTPTGAARLRAQDINPRAWMSRDEIVAAFVDKERSGIYPNGVPWQERIFSDGTSDYREGSARRTGHWWMTGDDFCFAYVKPQSGGCFRISQIGQNCYELYAVGLAARNQRPSSERGHWNGRMWRENSPATCDEKPAV